MFHWCFYAFYENTNKFPLTKVVSLTSAFFETKTKLNFRSSNANNFYILTSNTIIDKCFLETFEDFFNRVSTRFPLPTLTELILVSCRYLIPKDWKQTTIWMRLLSKYFNRDNAWVFWKVFFELEAFSHSIRMGLSLEEQLMSSHKVFLLSAKFIKLPTWSV